MVWMRGTAHGVKAGYVDGRQTEVAVYRPGESEVVRFISCRVLLDKREVAATMPGTRDPTETHLQRDRRSAGHLVGGNSSPVCWRVSADSLAARRSAGKSSSGCTACRIPWSASFGSGARRPGCGGLSQPAVTVETGVPGDGRLHRRVAREGIRREALDLAAAAETVEPPPTDRSTGVTAAEQCTAGEQISDVT